MSPENLVEAGISKQCLVPCLRELKLRLPTNIDLSDVVLYDPPKDITSTLTPNVPSPSPKDGGDRLMDTGEREGSSDALPASSPYKRKRKNMAHHQARASLPNSFAVTPSAPGEQATSLLQRLQTTGQPGNEPNSSGGIANVNSARHRSLPPPLVDDKQQLQQDTPFGGPALRGQKKPGKTNAGRGRWAGRGRGFHAVR